LALLFAIVISAVALFGVTGGKIIILRRLRRTLLIFRMVIACFVSLGPSQVAFGRFARSFRGVLSGRCHDDLLVLTQGNGLH
jgi:hypothetical protein